MKCLREVMPASVSQDGRFRAIFLSVIMVLMTQVGYTDSMDFDVGFDEENDSLQTGGSTSNSSSNNISPSRDNVVATVGEPMTEISWYHDVSPSGGNAGTTTQGNGSAWVISEDTYVRVTSTQKDTNIGVTIGDSFYYVATGGGAIGGVNYNNSRVIYAYNKSSDTVSEVGTFGTMPTLSSTRALDIFANVGDVLLFDGPDIGDMMVYNPVNDTAYSIGVSYSGNPAASKGTGKYILVGDTIYFAGLDSATTTVGSELYAYNAGNDTTWLAADVIPTPSNATFTVGSAPGFYHGFRLIGDTIYFDGFSVSSMMPSTYHANTSGLELYAYDLSNQTSWQVTDIDPRPPVHANPSSWGSGFTGHSLEVVICDEFHPDQTCGENTMTVVGDVLYFQGKDSNNDAELYAHNASNHTTWRVVNINTIPSSEVDDFTRCPSHDPLSISHSSSFPRGFYTIGETVYFTANNGYYGQEVWAYDTTNNSAWQVTRFATCDGQTMLGQALSHQRFSIVGEELFFTYGGLWVHNDTTQFTKRIWTPNKYGEDSYTELKYPGTVVLGDTIYGLLWNVGEDAKFGCSNSNTVCATDGPYGHTTYPRKLGLLAYDTSNDTLYKTATYTMPTQYGSYQSVRSDLFMASGDTIFFNAILGSGPSGKVFAYQPAEISHPQELVSDANCTVSPALPAGLIIDNNRCTISGIPTGPTSETNYTVTANINNATYQGNVLITTSYSPIVPSVDGSDAIIGTPIDNITFQIDTSVASAASASSGGSSIFTGTETDSLSQGPSSNRWNNYGAGLLDWSNVNYLEYISPVAPAANSYSTGTTGGQTIAVDSNGHVHIAYTEKVGLANVLSYATNQSGSWQSTIIDEGSIRNTKSIALDSNDNVHIAYLIQGTSGYNLNYTTNESGSWTSTTLQQSLTGSSISFDSRNFMVIDSNDNVHIAYHPGNNHEIKITNNTGGSWTVNDVYSNWTYSSLKMSAPTLAIDSNDNLHLTWGHDLASSGLPTDPLLYATNKNGSWNSTIIPDSTYCGNSAYCPASITIDSNDNAHVFYYNAATYNARIQYGITHSTYENGSWTSSTIPATSCSNLMTCGRELQVVMDSNDNIHIAFTQYPTATNQYGDIVLQYTNNLGGYFTPGVAVDVIKVGIESEMIYHPNGDVDFIYSHQTSFTYPALLMTSMNNSELNPSNPMYLNNKFASGYNHSCGIIHDNSLLCWGSDYYGQLGDGGSNTDILDIQTYAPVDLGTGRTAYAVAAGHAHTCAILDDGSLKCWGDNTHGQLGDGSTTDRTSPVLVNLGVGNTAVAISAGHSHTCAILNDGTLKCWGQDNNGQVGDGGSNSDQNSPVTINVGSGLSAVMISAGIYHSCAVLDDDSIKCWGLNNNGQLGDGTTTNRTTPVSVHLDAGKTAFDVTVGMHHTCALVDSHTECWGKNDHYQTGNTDNGTNDLLSPVIASRAMTALLNGDDHTKLRAISAGYNHTCQISDIGMFCWGDNDNNQIPGNSHYDWYKASDGYSGFSSGIPSYTSATGVEFSYVAVSAHGDRTCKITSTGWLNCFGSLPDDHNLDATYHTVWPGTPIPSWFSTQGGNVQQWNNTAEPGSATVPEVVRYDDVKYKFSGGGNIGTASTTYGLQQQTCLVNSNDMSAVYRSSHDQWLHKDGALLCRGTGYGQSDFWSKATSHFVRMDIPVERDAEYISPGNRCAILDDGSLMCWGFNHNGQVGDGTTINRYSTTYVDLGPGRTAVAVDNDGYHTCAILDNGVLKCWGNDQHGQVGDGGTVTSGDKQLTPTTVNLPAGRTAVALATGTGHTCAILDNGSVMCWGYNSHGQLGNGNPATYGAGSSESSPIYVDLGTDQKPIMIDSSSQTTCVIFENGSLMCWGQKGATTTGLPIYHTLPSGTSAIDIAVGDTTYATTSDIYVIIDTDNRVCKNPSNGVCSYVNYFRPGGSSPSTTESADLVALALSANKHGLCAVLMDLSLRCEDGPYGSLQESWPMVGGFSDSGSGSGSGSSGGMSGVNGATCTVSPGLPPGLFMDSNTCTISGTPTAVASNTTYTITATLNNVTYQGTFWLSSGYHPLTPSVDGADLLIGEAMDDITFQYDYSAASGSGGGMTNVTGANCTVSPALPTGLSIDSSTCTISGTPSVATSNTTYTVTANISGTTYQGTVWLATTTFGTITSPVMGAELDLGEAMTPITLNYTSLAPLAPPVSWEIHPALPAGMSLSNGVISGTPSAYAVNQTYTIYANQSGETTTFDMYFSVDTNNPHTVVENQPIDSIGFQGPFQNGTTNWTVSPALPADLVMDSNTGEITGSVNGVLANTTYTVDATHSDGATETFTFSLQSLADLDGDGLPNELPSDYDAAEGPTSGLVADADDDADGLDDVVETNTGFYINTSSTGTDPLDPDTDGDGICDGPNSIPNVCVAGPDTDPFNFLPPPNFFALEGLDIGSLAPYLPAVGGTYEISPDLPASLVLDSSTGEISGLPTEILDNTTFTVWINMSDGSSLSWDFTMTVLKDTDGDGMPDDLPDDYDPSNPDSPGLIVDMDNDNDGILDSDETDTGTSPTNPDSDGDGTCDGTVSVAGICDAGPDAFPLDPSADTDTDGDGMPDTITGNSTSVPALVEDMDDDGDGVEDVNETGTWTYNGPTDTGTNPLNPDTDYDGTCDGPVDVYDKQGDLICEAGPDTELGNLAVGAHYAVNGSMIQSIRPEWRPTGAVWEISPDLPADLTIDPESGVIYGSANEVTENITYTIYGNGTFSDYTSNFNLQVLEDTDRDGEPNELPEDYDNSTVTPMVEDLDDDNDGLSDLVETGTGVYNGTSDYGTDPLNPDTDGDGICDGPNSIWPICINGPDSNPFGFHNGENIVLVENVEIDTPIQPPNQVAGAVWEISPALPAGLNLDTSSGIITGTATEVSNSVTYTLWANVSDFGRSDSVAISVMATFGLTVLEDSDGDGLPNELPEDYDTSVGALVEDDDDDNDGMLDTEEDTLGTDPTNPDSDGDGFCDGPADVYSADGTLVCRGPDSAPLDSALPVDTDGDMFPDEDPDGPGGLEADTDDDGDGHLDTFENDCGSDSLNATSIPLDMDGDEICDGLDEDIDGDGIFNILETNTGVYNSTTDTGTDPLNPDTDGDGICDGPSAPANGGCVAGADDFPFDPSASKDTDGDGMPDTLTGTSTSVPPLVEDLDDDDDGVDDELESDCDTNPLDAESVPTLNDDGNCKDSASSGGDSDGGFGYMWCIPCLLILLLLLLVPLLIGRDRVLAMLLVGPEPENTISEPEFVGGAGTQDDPFILAPAEGVRPGESVNSTEVITIDKMSRIDVDMMDFNQEINGDRFSMFETNINEVGTRIIPVGDDGEITINMLFDDGVGEPTYEGGEFTGLLKLGRASVYLSWTVTVEPDNKRLKEIEKQRKADEKAAKKAEEAEAKRMAKEEAEAKKKAEEEAAAAAKEAEEEEAAAAAALLAKEEEETEAKKKAEEEAAAAAKEAEEEEAAAALLVKKEEEAAAKKKAKEEADAKKAKEAEEKAAAKKKADEEKAKKAEETAAAALLVKKEEEAAAKKKAKEEADAKKAKEAEEKAAAKKKADEEKAKKAEEAAAAAAAAKPVTKEAKKKEELKRVKANASKIDFKVLGTAKASEKDDLQVIKGIGPFIEEKLNALGIYTYRQISKMNSKLEDSVNLAIEFFPGRVKRDQWVAQAKILLGEDVKIDEKALKKAEELERVAKKAEKIDFGTIGVASASDKDNLQELKGIGPFIEEKLNALGIFKFVQIAKMTSKIEDEVNIAIEFFPGRVKRDEWVKQAKERTK